MKMDCVHFCSSCEVDHDWGGGGGGAACCNVVTDSVAFCVQF